MKVAVVGGGPAGMMAAIAAASNGADVTLFDKNEKLGKKLYISGKGRCNLTNNCSPRNFLPNVVNNGKFLIGAINKFSPDDTLDFCAKAGLNVKTERGNRVFPASDKSSDVIKTFERILRKLRVDIRLNCGISAVSHSKNAYLLTTITNIVSFDRVIIATGGRSYPLTGSTGDGYAFAKSLGHVVTPLLPALCKIKCGGVKSLEGLSLKNVRVSLENGAGEELDGEFGEMLFADDAVTGPAVLTLSSRVNKLNLQGCFVKIDLKPALDCDKLDARIVRDFSERMNRDFVNSLDGLLPERLVKVTALQSGIPLYKKVNQITAAERAVLVKTLKGLKFPFKGLDSLDCGIVTAGGVDVKEINPSSMESRICKGLYFCGEVMDVDAYTGGYNIQIALSTGYVAGVNAAKE